MFIHVYEKKKPHHHSEPIDNEHYLEDWSAWKAYNNQNGLEENSEGGHKHKKLLYNGDPNKYDDDYQLNRENDGINYSQEVQPEIPDNLLVDEPQPPGNYDPVYYTEENYNDIGPDLEEPNQFNSYAIYEDVKEDVPLKASPKKQHPLPPKNHHYKQSFEEGYHRGYNTETGKIYQKDTKNFYDNEHQEEEAAKGGYGDEVYEKYGKHGTQKYYKRLVRPDRSGNKRKFARRFIITRMIVR